MNIIATFPDGLDHVTVNGLHQWDWGRKLEIHDARLPAVIEVHFACLGMTDAVVRTCSVVNSVATAVIPDICIEQAGPIVAWVVEISETSGETIRTITLPVIGRTRPAPSAVPEPEGFSDKYTQLLSAFNEQIASAGIDIQETATEAMSTIGTAVTNAETTIQEAASAADSSIAAAASTAESTIQDYLNQLTSGQVEAAKAAEAELAKQIPYVGGLPEVPTALIRYSAQEDCLRFSTPSGTGTEETLGEVPLRLMHVLSASGDSVTLNRGTAYTSIISAFAWTVVVFSIKGVEYESGKFRFASTSSQDEWLYLDINKYLAVRRSGDYLVFSNSSSLNDNLSGENGIKIIAVYQYNS